jgi:hypothetical protein
LQALVGNHLSYVIDVLRPTVPRDAAALLEPSELMDEEQRAAQMLNTMAERWVCCSGL